MGDRPTIGMSGNTRTDALVGLRLAWGAVLMGQVLFCVAANLVRKGPTATGDGVLMVAAGVLPAAAVGAWLLRRAIWGGSVATNPGRYAAGVIVGLALLEIPVLLALVGVLLGGNRVYGLVMAGIGFALTVAAFPRGLPGGGRDA